jgi:hypothetical protein
MMCSISRFHRDDTLAAGRDLRGGRIMNDQMRPSREKANE